MASDAEISAAISVTESIADDPEREPSAAARALPLSCAIRSTALTTSGQRANQTRCASVNIRPEVSRHSAASSAPVRMPKAVSKSHTGPA